MNRAWLPCACVLLALANPAKAQTCQLARLAEIPIATLPDGRFTVPMTVQGETLNFLVDTGGAVATLSGEQAGNLHLPLQRSHAVLNGVAGSKFSLFANVGDVSLGGIKGRSISVFIDTVLPPGADGTLAPDILKNFDVDFDLLHGKLNLVSPQHCAGQVVYWTNSSHVELPLAQVADGHIQVPVSVDGVKLSALLDTGSQISLISLSAAQALGVSESAPGLKLVSDNYAGYKLYAYPFKSVAFDSISLDEPHIQVVSDGFLPAGIDMIIGTTVLRRLHLYVAYGEQKLYLTPATAN